MFKNNRDFQAHPVHIFFCTWFFFSLGVLVSGFWGLSRHVNYLGEIVQAVALALPGWLATGNLQPWLPIKACDVRRLGRTSDLILPFTPS